MLPDSAWPGVTGTAESETMGKWGDYSISDLHTLPSFLGSTEAGVN